MTRLLLVVLAAVLLCVPSVALAGVTYYPGGLIIGDIEDSPGVTPGDDDLYIKGTFEVDGAARFDGAITFGDAATDAFTLTGYLTQLRVGTGSTPDLSLAADNAFVEGTLEVDGQARFDGAVALGNSASADTVTITADVTLAAGSYLTLTNDDLIIGDASNLAFKIDADSDTLRITGSTNPGSLRDRNIMTLTTSTVTVVSTVLDVSDVELATISSRAGDLSMTVADSTAQVTFAGPIVMTAAKSLTMPATAYATQLRVGTGSSPGHSSDAADCLFVEGITEIDGAFYADAAATVAGVLTVSDDADFDATGGSTSDPDFGVDGYAKFMGNVEINNDDLIIGDASNLAFGIDADTDVLRVYGSTNPGSLRNVQMMGMTTSEVSVYAALGVGKADGAADKTITLYAADKTDATIVYDYSDDNIDINKYVQMNGAVVVAAAAPPMVASTPSGALWMTDGSPTAGGTVSNGAGGDEQPQANELYCFNGTKWVPMFTNISP